MMKTPNPAEILFETTTTTCGGAAERVGSIDDLLIQVFVHLPLKPLFRFKSVSKHWNSIISDPKFQFMLFKEHNNRAVVLIFQNYHRYQPKNARVIVSFDGDDRSTSLNPQKIRNSIPETLKIFHSCNGLLVLQNIHHEVKKQEYYVYNPTTKQISTNLLKAAADDDVIIKSSREQDCVCGMYLAFDPSKSPHYKVVCVWELDWMLSRGEEQYQFEVYSSETGFWKISGGGHITKGYLNLNNGVYWNGAIHWVGLFINSFMYFNPDHDEMPRVMPDPPSPRDCCRYYFGESCDHLHFAVVSRGDDENLPRRGIYVYEMRRDYSEWFLKFRVDDYSQCFLRNRKTVPTIYSVVRGKKDSDSFLVLGNGKGEIVRYNLVDNTRQTIPLKDFDFDADQTKSFQYIESPCSV